MTTPALKLAALWRRFHRDQNGTVAMIMALATVVIVGMMGFAIDIGHVLLVQRQLQASTDAAALAGAWQIPNDTAASPNTAVNAADNYAGESGDRNAVTNLNATMVSGYPLLKCLPNLAKTVLCEGPGTGANAIQVEQQAVVPMFFAKIFGIKTMTVTTLSTASARGGLAQPLNVMVVLDATGSMGQGTDSACNATPENCALSAIQDLLQGLNPSVDYVGLIQFPQLSGPPSNDCSISGGDSNAAYGSPSPATYVDVTPVNNYSTGYTAGGGGTLTSGTDIVDAVGGGSGKGACQGLTGSPTGGFASDAADAITEAQTVLQNLPDYAHSSNVIIILSDGEYNAQEPLTPTYNMKGCPGASGCKITGYTCVSSCDFSSVAAATSATDVITNQALPFGLEYDQGECQLSVSAAQAAAAAGTVVYAVAYAAASDGNEATLGTDSECVTDVGYGPQGTTTSKTLSACEAMQEMASTNVGEPSSNEGGANFYSANTAGSSPCGSQNQYATLAAIFKNIAENLTEPRLIPDNTT